MCVFALLVEKIFFHLPENLYSRTSSKACIYVNRNQRAGCLVTEKTTKE